MNKYLIMLRRRELMERCVKNAYHNACAYTTRALKGAVRTESHDWNLRIALHAVLIPRENILFLKEWIEYYRLLGVTEFYLYDNGLVSVVDGLRLRHPSLVPGQVNKYGIPYEELVGMDDNEIWRSMQQIQDDIPGVYFIPWAPKNEHGQVTYSQVEAHNHIRHELEDSVDWILSVDTDEFIVLPEGQNLQTLCTGLGCRGRDYAYFPQVRMADRWWSGDERVLDHFLMLKTSDPEYWGRWTGKKYVYRPASPITHLKVHRTVGSRAVYWLDQSEAIMLHYNIARQDGDDHRFVPCPYQPSDEIMNQLKEKLNGTS